MTRHCTPASLRFELSQMRGDCFYFYVRTPEMWNGLRRLYHVHKGSCNNDCEPNCDGYNAAAASAVLLVAAWINESLPVLVPHLDARKPLDQIVAEIAAGLVPKKPKKRGRRA